MAAMPSAAAPVKPRPSEVVAETDTTAPPSAADSACSTPRPAGPRCGSRTTRDDLDGDVPDVKAGPGYEPAGLPQQGSTGRAGPFGPVRAELGAQIAEASRGQQRAAGSMRCDISVRMPGQAVLTWPVQTGQVKRAFARADRVHVNADADRAAANRPSQLSRKLENLVEQGSAGLVLVGLPRPAPAPAHENLAAPWRACASRPRTGPAPRSRRHRSRTTSATLLTSPDASFSRLALYRPGPVGRLLGVRGAAAPRKRAPSPSWPTTSLTPTSSALSAGTRTVRSPLSTLSTR